MKKPAFVRPDDDVTVVGRVFGTPVVVKGLTWFPLTQLVVWGVMSRLAGQWRPARSWWERLGVGALMTTVALGSEWCHNLAHAAAAQWVGKPMDAMRINLGMPLAIYYDIEDRTVTPRQHIARALGGPAFNALVLPLTVLWRRSTRPGSAARDAANAAVSMNAFISTVSLLPIPIIDGGPVLKWSLVERGRTPAHADEVVKGVNRVMGTGLGLASAIAFRKRKRFIGAVLAMFAVSALAFGFGVVQEQ